MNAELRPEQTIKTPETIANQEQTELLDSRKIIEANQKNEQPATAPTLPNIQTTNTNEAVSSGQILLTKVEAILASDMDKIFLDLDLATQAKFKARGEDVAIEITNLLLKTKVQIKKVITLIMDWLRIIPNVNKYYLEQEAKLKADALLRLYKK